MKTIFTLFLFAISISVSAQSVIGKWKTIDDETGKSKSVVEIYKNGDSYEGKIVKLFRAQGDKPDPICDKCPTDDTRYNKKVLGMVIIKDMEMDDGELDEGTILDPKKGEVYDCKIWLGDEGKLNVRGYVAFFFRTQRWERYTGEI